MNSENIDQIATALAAAQGELVNPPKNKKAKAGAYSYNYADIADVLDCVRPVLSKHGIAVTQPTVIEGDILLVHTRLTHKSGQWMGSDYPVCRINGDHQKMGAALTYGKRYALSSLVGVAADEDTDGQGAAEVEGPKNGNGRTKQTMPQIQARRAAKEYDIGGIERDLAETETLIRFDSLEKAHADIIAHNGHVAEMFARRKLELQLAESLDAEGVNPRESYLQECRELIASDEWTNANALRVWWSGQAAERRRLDLTQPQVDELKELVGKRCKELPSSSPRAPAVPLENILDAG